MSDNDRKFDIGDRVVTDDGDTGTVKKYYPESAFPYRVKMDHREYEMFAETELSPLKSLAFKEGDSVRILTDAWAGETGTVVSVNPNDNGVSFHYQIQFPGYSENYGFDEHEVEAPESPVAGKKVKVKAHTEPDKETVYISGPMTGKPEFNFPLFYEMEDMMEGLGYRVINPARLDDEENIHARLDDPEDDFDYRDLLKRDLDEILGGADKLIVFDDWTNSRGATNEAFVADVAGIPVEFFDIETGEFEEIRMPVPFEAKEIVLGARRYDYGHPKENFERIADLWTAYFRPKLKDGITVDVRDVAFAMVLLKMARELNAPKPDNLVDIVGYVYALDETYRQAEREGQPLDELLSDALSVLRENSVEGSFS